MTRRAFTLVELSVTISIVAVLVPVIYGLALAVEENHALALWLLRCADDLRTLEEELQADARRGTLLDGPLPAWNEGSCEVRYRLDDAGVIHRDAPPACGGSRALASGVGVFERQAGGVVVVFRAPLRPTHIEQASIFLPLEVP